MDLISEENYIIAQAKKAHETDPFTAKAWIITAKTLYPNNFHVQYEAYKIEKAARNFEEAAKCFSYIILTFQSQHIEELWSEVSELTAALRVPEGETSPEQDFYVKMFQHVSYDVQHKILLLTANHSDNNLDHCKLVLLLLKRFPQAITTHSPRLLETIIQGVNTSPLKFQEMLIQEALPLIYHKPPELPSPLVYRIYTIALEYYTTQLIDENQENVAAIYEVWKQIFHVLTFCGKILNWPAFLPFNKNWSKDVYWQKIVEMASLTPQRSPDNKQIFFCATTLLIFCLQEYFLNVRQKIDGSDVEFILVEGFREQTPPEIGKKRPLEPIIAIDPVISVSPPCGTETQTAFTTAANCWKYLTGTDDLQIDFSQLLIKLPLSNWVSRFLFDLAVYFGHFDEAKKLLSEMKISSIRQNIRILSLNVGRGPLTMQACNCILQIMLELPSTPGSLLDNMTIVSNNRHMMLLPLTQRAVIQYCARTMLNTLKLKMFEPTCPDSILGDILVLSQLEYPKETAVPEGVFAIISARKQFTYHLFPAYIIAMDFLEEFMHIWDMHHGKYNFEFTPVQQNAGARRIGTRGADKGVRDDFKQIMKQQVSRANEDISLLIAEFITKEHANLLKNIF